MFFFFSKVLLIFIFPFTWFLALFITALIVKKPKLRRRFLVSAVIVLLIFSNPFLFNRFAQAWNIAPQPLKKTGSYSCAIVLGGFAGEDANGDGVFNASADRFIQGLKLVVTGRASHILISGGNGNLVSSKFREADWVKTQLKLLNVPDSCILIEDQSRNTLENAAFSKKILANNHLQPPYVLLTSAFHMRRAYSIFKKEKIEVIPYSCNYIGGNANFSMGDLLPDAGTFGCWDIYIKEVVGVAVNHLK